MKRNTVVIPKETGTIHAANAAGTTPAYPIDNVKVYVIQYKILIKSPKLAAKRVPANLVLKERDIPRIIINRFIRG